MDDVVDPSGSGAPGDMVPPPEGGAPAPADRPARGSLSVALILAAAAVLVGLQVAGVLLRDRVEGRLPILAQAPEEAGGPAAPGPGSSTVASRFGPEVREVPVASPLEPPAPPPAQAEKPTEALPAPSEEAPAVSAAPPPEPEPAPEAPAPAAPPPGTAAIEPAPPAPPPAAAPKVAAGTHALQVGVFRSQRYRHEMEQTLTRLDLPFFREETWKDGSGYRLAVPTPTPADRRRAREVLDAGGYVYREGKNGVEAFFHLEDEAQAALALLSRAGLNGGYGKIEAPLPRWTVYAGPFSREVARRTQDRLEKEGIRSILRKRP